MMSFANNQKVTLYKHGLDVTQQLCLNEINEIFISHISGFYENIFRINL